MLGCNLLVAVEIGLGLPAGLFERSLGQSHAGVEFLGGLRLHVDELTLAGGALDLKPRQGPVPPLGLLAGRVAQFAFEPGGELLLRLLQVALCDL